MAICKTLRPGDDELLHLSDGETDVIVRCHDETSGRVRWQASDAHAPSVRNVCRALWQNPTTREALSRAIERCVPGGRLGDLGAAVQSLAESRGYSVVTDLVGHGIGRAMHEPPDVPNTGTLGRGLRLSPGLVIAIEPMLNAGGSEVSTLADGWTVVADDGSLSAHFEHTVAITDVGPVVLTAP